MNPSLLFLLAATAIVALGPTASAAPPIRPKAQATGVTATITPRTHSFGKVVVGSQVKATFSVQLRASANPNPDIWGPNARVAVGFPVDPVTNKGNTDFRVPEVISQSPFPYTGRLIDYTSFKLLDCAGFQLAQAVNCSFDVYFMPKHVGVQSADLVVVSPGGQETWAVSAVTGEGIPGCVMNVVPCNYGMLYSGTFSWNRDLIAPGNQYKEEVQVAVQDGVAQCSGRVTEVEDGRTTIGTIGGPGLFAIEFEPDAKNSMTYRITAACPTPKRPAIPEDGVAVTESQPAELGHNDQNSERQPAKELLQSPLQGTLRYQAPETDPVNQVSGMVSITWDFKRQ